MKAARRVHSSEIIALELVARNMSVMDILERTKIAGWADYFSKRSEMTDKMAEELSDLLGIKKETLYNLRK